MRYAVLLGIALVALPLLVRLPTSEPFPDAASYETLRTSQLGAYDSLYAHPYTPSLTDRVFALAPPQLILLIAAALSLLLFALPYGDEYAVLLFATSPAFIATYTLVGPAAIGLTLGALAVALVAKGQHWGALLIPLCFAFGFNIGFLIALLVIIVSLAEDAPFVALGASFFALVSGLVVSLVSPGPLGFTQVNLQQLFLSFGATSGLTIFLLTLGIVGFFITWSQERNPRILLGLLAVPPLLFFEHGTLILAAILAYYGSRTVRFLLGREWSFEELKTITVMLVVCGVLFTTIVEERERLTVDGERVAVTRFLQAAYPAGTIVVADDGLAPLLAYNGFVAYTTLPPQQAAGIATTLVVTKTAEQYSRYTQVYGAASGYRVYETRR